MKQLFLLLFFAIPILSAAQIRIVSGKVVNDRFLGLPGAIIETNDNIKLGITDLTGEFRISLPAATRQLQILGLGLEKALITLTPDCDKLEIIVVGAAYYDFISNAKIERKRKKRFDNIPKLYTEAFKKGIFKNPVPCYIREFVSERASLDSITAWMRLKGIENKKRFKEFKIGDIVRIPFFNNGLYSAFGFDVGKFDCVIQAVILGKDRV